MGLFENLFKPRPDDTIERIVERPSKGSKLIEMREEGVEEEPPPDPATAFLEPKGYAPSASSVGVGVQNQGFVPVLPSAKRAQATERKSSSDAPAAATSVVILTVGDVLPRIPVGFLRPGRHDLKRELRFPIEDLAPDITRGRPEIALSCIAAQCPDLFNRQIGDDEDMAIRLPLQKLVEQVGRFLSHPPAPTPLVPFPTARPAPVAPEEKRPELAAVGPVVDKVAEPVLRPPVAPRPAPPLAVTPPREPTPEPLVEVSASLPEEPLPAPVPVPERQPAAGMIDLSLAAIVAKVPGEMLPGPRPRIADGDRISLPFPMIERQLGTGSVSIPAKVFWSALPSMLRHHFVLREDLAIPVPLEEIFQNLPVGGRSERPRFDPIVPPSMLTRPVEPPVVLAPAPIDDSTPPLNFDPPPPLPASLAGNEPLPAPPTALSPTPPEPAPPVVAEAPSAPESATLTPEEILLAPIVATDPETPSVASTASDEAQPGVVQLQPFRVFHLPTPDVEPEPEPVAEATDGKEVAFPPMSAATEEPVARMFSPPAAIPDAEPAAVPPDPEPLAAFNPDQPPPLRIEEPAVAVAVLRASVQMGMEVPAAAMATVSVQPPPMFRPMVLAPPIASATAPPIRLAPTLAGPGSTDGLVSLSPSPEPQPPAAFPAGGGPMPQPPRAPAAPAPTPKASPAPASPAPSAPPAAVEKKRVFAPAYASTPPATPPPPPGPVVAASHTPAPERAPEPFHLHLPPLPSTPAPAPPHPEHAPPSLPISRFDQHSLQSLFMTEEMLDLPKVCRLAAGLPGIQACVIATRGQTFTSGQLPEGFQLSALRGLSPQVDAAADRLPIGQLKNFTLYGEQYSVSFFERTAVCLCAIHRARSFVPGVREKLVAVVDELARG